MTKRALLVRGGWADHEPAGHDVSTSDTLNVYLDPGVHMITRGLEWATR